MVEPEHRRDPGLAVPVALIDATAGQVRLRCTTAEFGKLDPAEETQFIPGTGSYAGDGPGQVSYWPYYGLGTGGVGMGVGMGSMGLGSMGLAGGSPLAGRHLRQRPLRGRWTCAAATTSRPPRATSAGSRGWSSTAAAAT